MKRKRIIDIRNIVLSGAVLLSTVVAGLTNASASEIKNVNPTTDGISQTVMNNAELQRLGGGLIIDPTRIMPDGVVDYGKGLPKWVAVNDAYEEGFKEDGTSIGMKTHIYNITKVEVDANADKTHTKHITAECKSCGHVWKYDKTQKCDFGEGVINRDKTIYTCQTDGCGNSYTKSNSHINNGGGSHGGSSGDNEPSHKHSYGEWKSLNDSLEYATCTSCGEKITRAHKFKTPVISIKTNNDGTHTVITNETCVNCNHTKKTTETKNCNYETTNKYEANSDKTHIHTITDMCNECNHSKTISSKEENCNFELTNTKTETNGDVTETYTCNATGCGNSYSKTIPGHKHNYVSMGTSIVSNNNGTHNEIETKKCSCGDIITNTLSGNIACTFGPETIIDNQYVSKCTGCGYEKTRPYVPEHKHTYVENGTKISSKGNGTHDIYKVEKCSDPDCGHEIETLYLEDVDCTYGVGVPNEDNTLMTYTCNGCGHTKTEEIKEEHKHDYDISTHTKSNNDGTHDVIETKKCDCGDEIVTTISSGVACTESSQEEIKNDDGETIQIVYKCSCGYTVRTQNVDPKPVEHIHTPDSGSPYTRKPGNDCCYETYYICSDPDCGQEYGTKSFGHVRSEPDELGVVICTVCKVELDFVPTKSVDGLKSESSEKLSNPTLQEEILYDTFEEIEYVTPSFIPNEEVTKSESGNITIPTIEDTITVPVEEPKQSEVSEVEKIIENGNIEAEQVIEAGKQEAADVIEEGRKEVEEIIKSLDTDLQERLAESDARIASLLASNPFTRLRRR